MFKVCFIVRLALLSEVYTHGFLDKQNLRESGIVRPSARRLLAEPFASIIFKTEKK